MKVIDITFKEYVELKDRTTYDYYLRYADFEPGDLFGLNDITEHTYGFVKDVQELLNYTALTWGNYTELLEEYNISTPINTGNLSLFKLHCSKLWLKEQIEQLNELESIALGQASTAKEQAAGVDMFAEYRSFIQLDKLSDGDILKYDEIKKMPYLRCFTKLKLEADKQTFQINLNNLNKK